MTTTVDIDKVVAAIAALTIPGVTIRGVSGVADSMLMTAKTLAPRPEKFITGARLEHAEMTQQLNDFWYTLHYRYYHVPIGEGLGGLVSAWPGLVTNVAAIMAALSSHTSYNGSVDGESPSIDTMGPVMDPAGNAYLGAEFSITILQHLEA